ncbi:MAG: hypothetical protein JF609_12240, partial [Verrucomicrobia bacterium]|nr:hypothetical protein [Verrucomicrobiota bacterium]
MIKGISILLLMLGFVIGCLAVGVYDRRLRARARNGLELRYLRLRFMLWIFALLFVLQSMLREVLVPRHNGQSLLSIILLP